MMGQKIIKIMPMNTKKLSRILKVLGNERRLRLIFLLRGNQVPVIELSQYLKVSFQSVSKHLQKLEREGIVARNQISKCVYYKSTNAFRKSGIYKQIIKSGKE